MNTQKPLYYVGVGASAGGLEAIESFFSEMPTDTGLAFIVIQHLSPDYKSLMVELLSKKTKIAVERIEDGMTVYGDTIYLIPPKTNVVIREGKLVLTPQDYSKGINLPIDTFFASLADDAGEKSAGIILSGTGSDGVRGLRAIKAAGGLVMAQSPQSAKFTGMPDSAIATGLADFILDPKALSKQLVQFCTYPENRTLAAQVIQSEDSSLKKIFMLIDKRCQVDFTHYKMSTVSRRIERRIAINQLESVDEYLRYLNEYPAEVGTLYKEMLIGVTNFFRDPEVFTYYETEILPSLIEKIGTRELRFWSAGCSTGEEAYSFAIMLREYLDKHEISALRHFLWVNECSDEVF